MRSREVRDAFIEQLGSPWATKLLGEWPNRRMGPIDRLNLARRAEVELQGAARADLGELEVRLREDAVAALGDGVGEPDPHRRGAAHARDLLAPALRALGAPEPPAVVPRADEEGLGLRRMAAVKDAAVGAHPVLGA